MDKILLWNNYLIYSSDKVQEKFYDRHMDS